MGWENVDKGGLTLCQFSTEVESKTNMDKKTYKPNTS